MTTTATPRYAVHRTMVNRWRAPVDRSVRRCSDSSERAAITAAEEYAAADRWETVYTVTDTETGNTVAQIDSAGFIKRFGA